MLLFKKKFLPAILAGQKTQTIRLWKHRRMRPGQRSYIPGAGHIRLIAVDEVDLAQLTAAVEHTLAIGALSADAVRVILQARQEPPVGLFSLDGRPHLKLVRVQAPDLQAYRVLAGGGA